MRTDEFDYPLPPELIAQEPIEPRDHSRLMVLYREIQTWEHRRFDSLPEYLRPGDVLVRNVSRVLPARLRGIRSATGGAWEGLYLRSRSDGLWEALTKTRGRPRLGECVEIKGGLRLTLMERLDGGVWVLRPEAESSNLDLLQQHGEPPLPPYIRKGHSEARDVDRYQTVHARVPGSVAAPTAGLHFTNRLWESIQARGVELIDVTLHVGVGTFRPIEAETIDQHVMHSEWAELAEDAASRLNACRARGGRILAVGTTSARTLESSADTRREFRPLSDETSIYIRPGHAFQGIDGLLTNFHLPRSSLFVLVSALGGLEFMRRAYEEAIRQRYRFYSYGDAMLIF